jgi:hypothetical protein
LRLAKKVGEVGLVGVFGDCSRGEAELEYLVCLVENVGVTGDGISDVEEL